MREIGCMSGDGLAELAWEKGGGFELSRRGKRGQGSMTTPALSMAFVKSVIIIRGRVGIEFTRFP